MSKEKTWKKGSYIEGKDKLRMVLFPPEEGDLLYGEDGFIYVWLNGISQWAFTGSEWFDET